MSNFLNYSIQNKISINKICFILIFKLENIIDYQRKNSYYLYNCLQINYY